MLEVLGQVLLREGGLVEDVKGCAVGREGADFGVVFRQDCY